MLETARDLFCCAWFCVQFTCRAVGWDMGWIEQGEEQKKEGLVGQGWGLLETWRHIRTKGLETECLRMQDGCWKERLSKDSPSKFFSGEEE